MNKLLKQSYDKFENKTITITESVGGGLSRMNVKLHHYSSPNGDVDCIDVVYTQKGGQDPRLIEGGLILLLNGSTRYSLEPKVNIPPTSWWEEEDILGSWPNTHKVLYWKQDMYYQLPDGLLREMAYAKSVEIKVIGASVDLVLEDECYPSLQLLTKVLYNAVYDDSAFADDIQQECSDHENKEQIYEELENIRKEIVKECEKISSSSYFEYKFSHLGFSYFDKNDFNKNKDSCLEYEEFYNVLSYAIPKYEALLEQLKKYRAKFPKYAFPFFEEDKIQEFINALKETREEIDQKSTRKKVIIGIVVAVVIIIIIAIAV